jgi:hypothetical protein
LVRLGFEQGRGFALRKKAHYVLSYTSSPFCSSYFGGDRSNFCLDWPQTEILVISAFQVARITGMSHRCPACSTFLTMFPH